MSIRLAALIWAFLVGTASAQTVGSVTGPVTPASVQSTITTPVTGTNFVTTAYRMAGLAVAITPTMTGTLNIDVTGTLNALSTGTAATVGIAYQIYYGTGAAPTNGATATGTAVGIIQQDMNGATITVADYFRPFGITAQVTGTSVGTPYWVDLGVESLGTAAFRSFSNVNTVVTEMP